MDTSIDRLNFIKSKHWLFFNKEDRKIIRSLNEDLAYEDAFLRWLPQLALQHPGEDLALLHIYPINQATIILGQTDTRLPHLDKGLDFLKEAGYYVTVRPHGGLAIVCDPGILNFSLIINQDHQKISIDQAYQMMVDFLQTCFASLDLKIEVYEIPNSYCPGSFDLVVDGKKIGGLAQKRFKSGLATAAYLSADGDQVQRGTLIKNFYQIGGGQAPSYPQVDPEMMTTLSQVIGGPFSQDQCLQMIQEALARLTSLVKASWDQTSLEEAFQAASRRLSKHQAKVQ